MNEYRGISYNGFTIAKGFEKESVKRQLLTEYNSKIELDKSIIPTGRYCNPELPNHCPFLASDYCLFYHKGLATDSRMSDYFHRQRKTPQCNADKHGGKAIETFYQTKLDGGNEE